MLNFPCWVHLLSRPDPTFLCPHLNDLTVCFSYTVFYCVYKATKKTEIWGLISSDRMFTRMKSLRGEKNIYIDIYNSFCVCDLHLKPFLSLWNFGECWSKGLSSIACGYCLAFTFVLSSKYSKGHSNPGTTSIYPPCLYLCRSLRLLI